MRPAYYLHPGDLAQKETGEIIFIKGVYKKKIGPESYNVKETFTGSDGKEYSPENLDELCPVCLTSLGAVTGMGVECIWPCKVTWTKKPFSAEETKRWPYAPLKLLPLEVLKRYALYNTPPGQLGLAIEKIEKLGIEEEVEKRAKEE